MTDVPTPRPLPLHLANTAALWGSAAGAAGLFQADSLVIHPSLKARFQALKTEFGPDFDWAAFTGACTAEAAERSAAFLRGLRKYMAYDYVRPRPQATVCTRLGTTELLDYGGDGTPLLLIPSLINPYYILDLMPDKSLALYLKQKGFRPFLINWGEPGEAELPFGLEDYIQERLVPLLAHISKISGTGKVPVAGYCMGGTLATGLASVAPEHIRSLTLIAAPWKFSVKAPMAGKNHAPAMQAFLSGPSGAQAVPIDLIQTFFAGLDTTLNDRKFRRFAGMKDGTAQADFFVALEGWANSGAPLPHNVARDCLSDWYLGDKPFSGTWKVGTHSVDPAAFKFPTHIIAPLSDRLVPQESALAIKEQLRDCTITTPQAGHVGMVVGSGAENGLYRPLAKWLKEKGT